jgi:polyvinyl alcohol dehydrogenase (cytochrome)
VWKVKKRHARRDAVLPILAIGLGSALLVAPAGQAATVGLAAAARAHSAAATSHGWSEGSWASWGRDLSGSRYAAKQSAITPANIGGLTEKWAFAFPGLPGVFESSQPAVVGSTMYVGSTDAKFYSLDATTGATRWVFDLTQVSGPTTATSPNPVRDGATVADGTVYFGDSRGYVYAVNRYTGQLRWATLLDSTNPDVQLTGSPIIYGGRVFIGLSNKESGYQQFNLNYPCCTARGEVVALDATTGSVIWRHYTVPAAQPAGTWPSGATLFAPSGISVWSTPVIDPALGTLYVGTGQNYTGASGEADSVLALDLGDGHVRWQFQAQPDTYTSVCDNPQDVGYCPSAASGTNHDWDFGASGNLFHLGARTVFGIGDKAGVFRAFDARTGQVLWSRSLVANPSVPGGNAGEIWGSSYDGHSIYVATWFNQPGVLYALDPATGAIRWQAPSPADGCSTGGAVGQFCAAAFTPAVTSSPGIVFEGNADGKIYAFSAATGALLWQYDTVREFQGINGVTGHGESVSGIGGAVLANGMLYVQSGYYPISASTEGPVLLAFSVSTPAASRHRVPRWEGARAGTFGLMALIVLRKAGGWR